MRLSYFCWQIFVCILQMRNGAYIFIIYILFFCLFQMEKIKPVISRSTITNKSITYSLFFFIHFIDSYWKKMHMIIYKFNETSLYGMERTLIILFFDSFFLLQPNKWRALYYVAKYHTIIITFHNYLQSNKLLHNQLIKNINLSWGLSLPFHAKTV